MRDYLSNLLDKACGYIGYQPFFCEPHESVNEVEEASYCDEMGTGDFEAYQLCELLRGEGYTKADIDTGLQGKVFRTPTESALPNGYIEPQEIYHKAIEVMEEEIYSLGEISPEEEKNLFSYKAWQIGFQVPWLPYDGNLETYSDEMYRIFLRGNVDTTLMASLGYTPLELATSLFDMSFDPNGLGLVVWNNLPVELDLTNTMRINWGDCSEISRVLYSMYYLAGYEPEFVWIKEDMEGDPLLHVAVMIDGGGRQMVADSHFGFNEAGGQSFEPLPALTSLALYYNNMSAEHRSNKNKQECLNKSLAYDPTYSLTYLYLSRPELTGENENARQDMLYRAYELDPESYSYLDIILLEEDRLYPASNR